MDLLFSVCYTRRWILADWWRSRLLQRYAWPKIGGDPHSLYKSRFEWRRCSHTTIVEVTCSLFSMEGGARVDSSSESTVLVVLGLQQEEGFTSWSGVLVPAVFGRGCYYTRTSARCAGVRTMDRNACADCGVVCVRGERGCCVRMRSTRLGVQQWASEATQGDSTQGGPRLSKGGCAASCVRKCRVLPRLLSPCTTIVDASSWRTHGNGICPGMGAGGASFGMPSVDGPGACFL